MEEASLAGGPSEASGRAWCDRERCARPLTSGPRPQVRACLASGGRSSPARDTRPILLRRSRAFQTEGDVWQDCSPVRAGWRLDLLRFNGSRCGKLRGAFWSADSQSDGCEDLE
uniref:Uncharacterized protein n=1 Tax=Oryza brachyantha TaxID=4533 RepID=J3N7L5_ORYBR